MSLAFMCHLPQCKACTVLQPLLAESGEQMGETIAFCISLRKDKRIRSLCPKSNLAIQLRHLWHLRWQQGPGTFSVWHTQVHGVGG